MKRRRQPGRIALTERALSDIRELERYSIGQWGRKAADRYLDDIAAALDQLAENPEHLRPELDFPPGLSFYRVRKHVLVCDCRESTIVVLTVVHTSMDLPARLAELEPRLVDEARLLHDQLARTRDRS